MTEEYPPTLAAALARLQTRLPRIAKSETAKVETKTGGSYSYSYAGLADISAQVLPLLGAVGLSFTSAPKFDPSNRYVLACKLLHASGEFDEGVYLLPTGGTPQSLGSAITYGRRYLLCSMTGIAPDEDDDGAAAEAAAAQPRTAQRGKQATGDRAAPARSTQRARRPAPTEPPLPGEAGDDDSATPAPAARTNGGSKPATMPQLQKLHIQLNELDVTAKPDQLTTIGLLVQRPLTSSKELTVAEASGVIDRLEQVLKDPEPVKAFDAVLDGIEQSEQDST